MARNGLKRGDTRERLTLRQMRTRKLWSARTLAYRAGLSERAVFQIEAGRVTPRLTTIAQLCKALEVAPEEIAWPGNPLEVA